MPLIGHFPESELQFIFLIDLDGDLLLSVGHFVLGQVILLLQIDNHLILPPNDLLIIIYLLFVKFNLLILLSRDICKEITQTLNLNVNGRYLVILYKRQLTQLLYLLLRALFFLLELFHHFDQVTHVLAACLPQVRQYLLAHDHLLLIVLQFHCQFLRVFYQASQILFLETLSRVQFVEVILDLLVNEHLLIKQPP